MADKIARAERMYLDSLLPGAGGCDYCEEGVDGWEEDCNCLFDSGSSGEPDECCALCGGKGTVVRCAWCGQVR